MHARIEHLLNLRDGEPVDAAVRTHVERCAICAAALAETATTRDRLRAMPALGSVSPPAGWPAIVERASRRRALAGRRRRLTGTAAAASVVILALAVAWRIADAPVEAPATRLADLAPLTAEQALAQDRVARLQQQSAALEEVLSALGARPVVQRAGTALPIDTLEAEVQWLDHRLLASEGDAFASEQLWRERVQTMGSLVRLRYVEASRVSL